MSQPVTRGASRVLRPKRVCAPAAFFHQCRASSIKTSQTSQAKHDPLTTFRAVSSSRLRSNDRSSRVPVMSLNAKTYVAPSRSFSTCTPFYATVVAQNPRQDEEGQDMTIEISPRAAKVCTSHSLQLHAERRGAAMRLFCSMVDGTHYGTQHSL